MIEYSVTLHPRPITAPSTDYRRGDFCALAHPRSREEHRIGDPRAGFHYPARADDGPSHDRTVLYRSA